MNDYQKLGWLIVLFILFCVWLGVFAAKADAATLEPTPRDWQRLNACSNAAVNPFRQFGFDVEEMSVKCAAQGKAVAKIDQLYPYKFGTPKKKNGNDEQNERVAYAWEISKWTESTAFLNMIAGENGKFEEGRRSNVVTKDGREKSWGFCQLNSYYKSRYFEKEKDGTVRIFTDWKYQMRVCFKEFQAAPHHFYGGLKNNMWMYEWETPSQKEYADQDFAVDYVNAIGYWNETGMPEFNSLYEKYLKLYRSMSVSK